jgi:hypothetical protein
MAPENSVPPTVTGSSGSTPLVGYGLSASTGTWDTPDGVSSYSYQWQRCGTTCVDIPGATYSSYSVVASDVGSTFSVHVTATNAYGSATAVSAQTLPAATPLKAYAPQLRYDSGELFAADSAGELTDNCYSPTGAGNVFYDPSFLMQATSCPGTGYPQLTLSSLGPTQYPWGEGANKNDYIDESDGYKADFDRMHNDPQYANWIYGREVPTMGSAVSNPPPPGSEILQYWFFYYDQPNFLDGGGAHEGDWEGIQILLDPNGTPINITYNQHKSGEECDWNYADHVGLHPVVYPAKSSHASYFYPGSYTLYWNFVAIGNDTTDGMGNRVIPSVVDITGEGGSGWLAWPGMWGGTHSGGAPWDQTSPQGPTQKGDQWSDPALWQSQLTCTPSQ